MTVTLRETKTAVMMALSLACGHVVSKMDLPTEGDRTYTDPLRLACVKLRDGTKNVTNARNVATKLSKWETNQALGRQQTFLQSSVVTRYVFAVERHVRECQPNFMA